MTIEFSTPGSVARNDASVAGAPAIRITGSGILFTNGEAGRVTSTAAGIAAIQLNAAGSTVINELGGIIRSYGSNDIAVQGSSGSDTFINYGLIAGSVYLGCGQDRIVNGSSSYSQIFDMGSDDDIFELELADGSYSYANARGGTGVDTFVVRGMGAVANGQNIVDFEHLKFENSVTNVDSFSNFLSIEIPVNVRINFLNCFNPSVDLIMNGGSIDVTRGSVFSSITGGSSGESVWFNSGTVTGNINLGGGNDAFYFTRFTETDALPSIGGTVDGGSGRNILNFRIGGGETIDLARFVNFSEIRTGNFSSQTSDMRIVNANGYEFIDTDSDGYLAIANSFSPEAILRLSFKSTALLESTAVLRQVGTTYPGLAQQAQGNDELSTTVRNDGTILGDVFMGLGDDVFDGRLGTVGGSIFGFAGNDMLYGSAFADRIDGGFGVDRLYGGGGDDLLIGGAGSDYLDGGSGADVMRGGAGNDVYIVDATGDSVLELTGEGTDVVRTDLISYILPEHVEQLIYTGSAGFTGTGNDDANIIFGAAEKDILFGLGGTDYLIGGGGGDSLHGGSGAANTLQGGTGNDTYYVLADGDSVIEFAGEGTDAIVAKAAVYALREHVENLFYTGAGDFIGIGNDAANWLEGSSGRDLLNGGLGNDILVGGAGGDFFVLNSNIAGGGNVDRILDFASGLDHIYLDSSIFSGISPGLLSPGTFAIGPQASDADDRIVFDPTTGRVFFDPDGSGALAATAFLQLQPQAIITASDITVY